MSLNVHFLVIGRDYRYLSISVLHPADCISTTKQHLSGDHLLMKCSHTPLDRIADHKHLNTFPDSCYSLPQSNWYIYMMWHTVEIAEVLAISCWKFYSSPMTKYMEGDCNLHWTFRLVCHHSPAYWELDAWIQFRAVFPWENNSPEYSAKWENYTYVSRLGQSTKRDKLFDVSCDARCDIRRNAIVGEAFLQSVRDESIFGHMPYTHTNHHIA